MPPQRLAKLPGDHPDVAKSRAEAHRIMQRLGYGPDKPLAVKVAIATSRFTATPRSC